MAVPQVIVADTWLLGDDEQIYPLGGPVQVASLSVLPARLTVGPADRDQEQIRSSWIIEDWSGGLGVLDMDETTESDRYYYGTLETRRRRTLGRQPRALAISGAPAGTRLRTGSMFGTTFYAVWDTKVRYLLTGGASWGTPAGGGYADFAALGTDALQIRLNNKDWLIIAYQAGAVAFDGTTWNYYPADATHPGAVWLAEWFGRVYTLDTNNVLWYASDGTGAFTKAAPLPVPTGMVKGLNIFFDSGNNPQLHASTTDGLWIYNADVGPTGQWFRTRLEFPLHPAAGAADGWHGDWYEAGAGGDVYHYTGGAGPTVNPMGLSRDDGLPTDWRGDIIQIRRSHNWLLAGLTAAQPVTAPAAVYTCSGHWAVTVVPDAPAKSAIFGWNGAAWHPLWSGDAVTVPLDWLGVISQDGKVWMLWGYGGVAYRQQMPTGVFEPRQVPNWAYADEGFIYSSWFDGGHPEWMKLACTFMGALQAPGPTGSADVAYAIDGADTWTPLTHWTTERPDPTIFGADGEGLPFHKLRLRAAIQSGDQFDPIAIDFMHLTYIPNLDRLYSITATIDLSDPHTAPELERQLLATIDAGGLVKSAFRRQGQRVGPQADRVFILSYRGLVGSGVDTYGKHTIQAVGISG